jgi:Cysteine protease
MMKASLKIGKRVVAMKRNFIGAFLIGSFFMSSAFAENKAVTYLNQELKNKKSTWVAKENWVTNLSRQEAMQIMGARDVEPVEVQFDNEPIKSTAPEIVDWRDRNGRNYVSPVLNQGNCGSCVAFATVATLETQMNITSLIPQLNPRFSPQALFACGGGECARGWWTGIGARYLVKTGVPDEACFPYTMGATGRDVACSAACGDSASRTQKALTATNFNSPAEVKAALRRGPLVTNMYVFEDFTAYSSGVYKHTKGEGLGGHAVSLIGFDDVKRAWIIRNSWGPEWGINGFGYVSYDDDSGIGNHGIQFEVGKETEYLWSPLRDRSYVSGETVLTVNSNAADAGTMSVSVANSDQTRVAEVSCSDARVCNLNFKTSELPDGRYELIARQGKAELHRYFYVSNKSDNFKIRISPMFDAKKAIAGRVQFALRISQDGSVPLRRLAFVFQNAKGVTKERWVESVSQEMLQGWRTTTTENGKYIVWYKGEQFADGKLTNFTSEKMSVEVANKKVQTTNNGAAIN